MYLALGSDSKYNRAQREGACLRSKNTICGEKEKKTQQINKAFWSNTELKRFQWLCWRKSSHCSMPFQLPGGKAVARAAWRAMQAENTSSLMAPETQHHMVGGLSGW